MVRWSGEWTNFLGMTGNKPGADTGDVQVYLTVPVAGLETFTCPSADLTVAIEAGTLIGLMVNLDGRHLLVPWANVGAILDAPVSET